MTQDQMSREKTVDEKMAEEGRVREKVDKEGNRWKKVYCGGGAHFRNWLNQFLELWGEENIEVEEIDSRGFQCYEEDGERMFRIWVKNSNPEQRNELL